MLKLDHSLHNTLLQLNQEHRYRQLHELSLQYKNCPSQLLVSHQHLKRRLSQLLLYQQQAHMLLVSNSQAAHITNTVDTDNNLFLRNLPQQLKNLTIHSVNPHHKAPQTLILHQHRLASHNSTNLNLVVCLRMNMGHTILPTNEMPTKIITVVLEDRMPVPSKKGQVLLEMEVLSVLLAQRMRSLAVKLR